MIYGERPRSKLHQDSKGLTGTRIYLCDWADVDPAPIAGLPHYGDPWSPELPFLRVVSIDAEDNGSGYAEYIVQYSTERQLGEAFFEASLDYGLEQIDCTKGYVWETAGTPVTMDIPPYVSVLVYTIRMRQPAPPYQDVVMAQDKINSKIFHGFARETMRFEGASTEESYDSNGNIISVQSSYRFIIRTRSHNEAWREPLQARDADGNPIYWHNIDPNKPFYTTDPTKIATPVWVNQVPGNEGAIAGTGGWDKMKNGTSYRYELCDFAAVLGLPKKTGDE